MIPHWPLPAVLDLTRDGRWSTYDVAVLKLSNISNSARMRNTLKLPPPTKLARLGHFHPGSQAGRLAGPAFYVYVFSLGEILYRLGYGGRDKCYNPIDSLEGGYER